MVAEDRESKNSAEEEQIEGLDDTIDSGLGDYPIDTLLIRKETRTVFDVVERLGNRIGNSYRHRRQDTWPPRIQHRTCRRRVRREMEFFILRR